MDDVWNNSWTGRLLELKGRGMTARYIAADLGITRKAVINKLLEIRNAAFRDGFKQEARRRPDQMEDSDLEQRIAAYQAALKTLSGETAAAVEKERQWLLHIRLCRDMERFVRRFDAKEARKIWRSFVGGLHNNADAIETKTGRSVTEIMREAR